MNSTNSQRTQETRFVGKLYLNDSDLDEASALYYAKQNGERSQGPIILKGINREGLIPMPLPADLAVQSPTYWASQKVLVIGGGGDFSDEHCDGEFARKKGKSSVLLMADAIGIVDPDSRKLIGEITYLDNSTGAPKIHLASLLKMLMIQVGPTGFQEAVKLCHKVLSVVETKMRRKLNTPARDEVPFMNFVEEYITLLGLPDDDIKKALMKVIRKEVDKGEHPYLSLVHIYESMWRTSTKSTREGKMEEVAGEFSAFFTLLYNDQKEFQDYLKIVQSKDAKNPFFSIDYEHAGKLQLLRAAIVRDKCPLAHNVLRYMHAMITIVMTPEGNVSVMGNVDKAEEAGILHTLDQGIVNFYAMCRYAELSDAERAKVTWNSLRSRGNCPYSPKWYAANVGWLSFYNGTRNHPKPSTVIPLDKIREYAQIAFNPQQLEEWKKRKGISDKAWTTVQCPRRRPQQAQQPQGRPQNPVISKGVRALGDTAFGKS